MKNFSAIPLTFLLLTVTTPAFAHPYKFHVQAHEGEESAESESAIEAARETREEEIETKVAEFKAAQEERRLSTLKDLCEKMIDHRLKELDRVQEKVDSADLTDEQKEELKAVLEDNDNSLDKAKEDCTSTTSLDSLKTMVRDIQRKQHIFASVLPKLHGLRFIDRVIGFIGRLTNHVATIQKHIDKAKDGGCDTTAAEAALTDYKTAVQEAQDHLNKAKDIIATFKDTEDPGARRDELKTEMTAMRDALKKARDAHKKIIAELKACRAAESGEEETEPST